MKEQITAAMMMLAMLTSPVMAQSLDNQAFEAKVFHSDADKPMQLAELSAKEMKETEGSAIWFAPALGGVATGFRFAVTGFTRHGVHRAISKDGVGVTHKAMMNTLRNPQTGSRSYITGPRANTTKYVGKDSFVVVNRQGKIVTAAPKNSNAYRIK